MKKYESRPGGIDSKQVRAKKERNKDRQTDIQTDKNAHYTAKK
jgi:hypothetical protein